MNWFIDANLRDPVRTLLREFEVATGACRQRTHQSRRCVLEKVEVGGWRGDWSLQSIVPLQETWRCHHRAP
jgi:hypothetical protein